MLNTKNILIYLISLPLIGIVILLGIPSTNQLYLKTCGLFFSGLTFLLSLILWLWFDKSYGGFQFVNKITWIPFLNLNLNLGIDGISIFFIILTGLLIFLCILLSWNSVQNYVKEYLIAFLAMEVMLLLVFSILDLLLFYVFFESILIPMFLIIGIWGSRERKIRAGFFFFLYTLLGSVLMLLSILYIYYQIGTTDYETLLTIFITEHEQKILWLAFFFFFCNKSSYGTYARLAARSPR